jgi:hypothetical protein
MKNNELVKTLKAIIILYFFHKNDFDFNRYTATIYSSKPTGIGFFGKLSLRRRRKMHEG